MGHVSSIEKVGDEAGFYRGREPVDGIRNGKRELRAYVQDHDRPGSHGQREGVNPSRTAMKRGSPFTGECTAGARRVAGV